VGGREREHQTKIEKGKDEKGEIGGEVVEKGIIPEGYEMADCGLRVKTVQKDLSLWIFNFEICIRNPIEFYPVSSFRSL